jgi:mRNA-degrading endonuclease YafQ of YafQ-DinJ toxin-antitoxin module
MTIDEVTKEQFDEDFKQAITGHELLIKEDMQVYIGLLDFRSQYRKDYATHHLKHYIENGILKYNKQETRVIGVKQ